VAAPIAATVATVAIVLWPESGRPGAAARSGAPTGTAVVTRRTLRESEIVSGTYGYEPAAPLIHRSAPRPGGSGSGSSDDGTSAQDPAGRGSGGGPGSAGSRDGTDTGIGEGGGSDGAHGSGARKERRDAGDGGSYGAGRGSGGGSGSADGGGSGNGGGAEGAGSADGGGAKGDDGGTEGRGSGGEDDGNPGSDGGHGFGARPGVDGGTGTGTGEPPTGAHVRTVSFGGSDGGTGTGASGESGTGSGGAGDSPGSGTLTETAAVGQVVRRGEVLYRVDQRPVRLLYGTVPAWRTLTQGLRGRDVRQLQVNLAALGYGPITVDGDFRRGTADAVRRWQRATGRPATGRLVLGNVVFADGARRVAAVEAGLGAPLADGATVLTTTSLVRMVRIPLDAAKQQLAKRGARVTVTLPNQKSVVGRIVAVGPVTSSNEDGGGGGGSGGGDGAGDAKATLDVLVRLRSSSAAGRLDDAPVSVALTRELRRRALTVPVTALVARSGGRYALRVRRGGSIATVPIEVGMFSDGLAQVSGGDVHEGDRVAVPDAA
jgi:peptidoglycan hydrolase-like protein with peptidoglycan-binding domain